MTGPFAWWTISVMRWAILMAAVVLAGCGGSGSSEPAPPATKGIRVALADVLPGTFAGWTHRHADGWADVLIRSDLENWQRSVMVAHELWHAVGFDYHTEGECLSALSPRASPSCPLEVEQMRGVAGVFTVYCGPDLESVCRSGAQRWNAVVGREMFLVEVR